MARTHDTSLINYHVKDLETFGHQLTEAANAAFPKGQPRYKEVHALLLSWEEDNLGVTDEVTELQHLLQEVYHYDTEGCRIPTAHAYKVLRKRISKFLDDFEHKDNLLIVYYGGHGFMNDDRQCMWSCTGKVGSPTVQWSGLQNNLEHAESDVLILLDCCAAASSISGQGSAVTEVIAACGFETWAPGVGEHSFTRSLIDEMKYWGLGSTLSAAMLHNKVLSRIKYWKPRFNTTGGHEHRKTPIYIVLANEGKQRSIELIPLQIEKPMPIELAADSNDSSSASSDSCKPSIEAQSSPNNSSLDSDSSQSSLEQIWPDLGFRNPKVLISLALEEDQWLHTDGWIEWMRSVPAVVKYAHVEGVYKSVSTLVLLSIPVAIWDLLPKDSAIAFISFIRSDNMLQMTPASLAEYQHLLEGNPSTGTTGEFEYYSDLEEVTEDLRLRVENWHGLDFLRFGRLILFGTARVGKDGKSWQELECFLFTEMLVCVKNKKGAPPRHVPNADGAGRREVAACTLKGSILIRKHLEKIEENPDEPLLRLHLSVVDLPKFYLQFQSPTQSHRWKQAFLNLRHPSVSSNANLSSKAVAKSSDTGFAQGDDTSGDDESVLESVRAMTMSSREDEDVWSMYSSEGVLDTSSSARASIIEPEFILPEVIHRHKDL